MDEPFRSRSRHLGFIRSAITGRCCPPNQSFVNGTCQCNQGFFLNNTICVCPTNETNVNGTCQCNSGLIRSDTTGRCCPPNEQFFGGSCNCNPTFYRDDGSKSCVCPQYQHVENGTCVCDTGFLTINGSCQCPPNEEVVAGSCRCKNGFYKDNATGVCVCPEFEVISSSFGNDENYKVLFNLISTISMAPAFAYPHSSWTSLEISVNVHPMK